ncbi:peptidylprolyl isomerase [uncultured Bartonella sp.]|uniref:peptidylprolyl isomerase n=1 Tax=uncultured Bartonella sp. TaxID=104108 RepID=UPI0025ECDB35|nr:peptidylprolyl isomerase [uncultured Bartonella sp.]
MKFIPTTFLLSSALLLGTSLTSIAQNAPQSTADKPATTDSAPQSKLPDPTSAQEAAPEKPVDPSHVMAVVDGKNITAGELDAMANDMDPGLARLKDQQRRITVLKIYIDMKTLSDAAVKEGLDKTPEYEKRMAIMRDNVLQQIYFKNSIVDKITDDDVKARYDKEIASLPKEEEVHARHILVKSKKEAEDIIKSLDKGGKFDEIAKTKSTDGSAATGGDLGYFTRGQMVKPFEDAAFGLKVGEYTKTPVESPFGWHIIKVEDRRTKQPPALADIKDTIRNVIARERYSKLIADLRNKMDVKYPDEEVAKLMTKTKSDGAGSPEDQSQDEDQSQEEEDQ